MIVFAVLHYSWLENVLGQVRSGHLEELELVVHCANHDGLETIARKLQGLDDLLSRKNLQSIHYLKIVSNDETVEEVERRLQMVEKLLPRFMKRGTIEMFVTGALNFPV